jgi:hypothetical protein
MHRVEIERTEERRWSEAHRRRRNRSEMPAGRRHFGKEFFGGLVDDSKRDQREMREGFLGYL